MFFKSEYVRYLNYNLLAHRNEKLLGSNIVFVGESITAGGRNWSMRLGGNPFGSINLTGSGNKHWPKTKAAGEDEEGVSGSLRNHFPSHVFLTVIHGNQFMLKRFLVVHSASQCFT